MALSKSDEFNKRTNSLARLMKALSHPARITILERLAESGTCMCGEIVKVLPLAQSTVSQHLKELREAELIIGEIDGPKCCYCLNQSKVKELEKLLLSFLEGIQKGLISRKCC